MRIVLAGQSKAWHGRAMASRSPVAGGFAIALGATVGGLYGINRGQPSAGLVIGAAIGTAVALLIWLLDRR